MILDTSSLPAVSNSNARSAMRATKELRVLAWPIDPLNPYTASLYAQMEDDASIEAFSVGSLRRRHDIWHIHWPEALLNIRNPVLAAVKIAAFLGMIDSVRLRGGKIVWTVHNLNAHDNLHPRLEALFYRRFIPRVDGVISLSETGLAMAYEKFSRLRSLPAAIIRHGHYRDRYLPCADDARSSLGIPGNARVILFFGEVRAYKNVDALVRAFRDVADTNARLLVAGRPKSPASGESVMKEAAPDPRVQLSLSFIEPERVGGYFKAADLVVLPYRHILNSGAALLALSFNRPVLVPDLGSMSDLRNDFGGSWVRMYSGEIDAAKLTSALAWAAQPRPALCPMPTDYLWNTIRAQTLEFYREVLGARRPSSEAAA